ncbi:MAG: hypothetical protein L6R41_008094, partial [Letrouitia leprolyta]
RLPNLVIIVLGMVHYVTLSSAVAPKKVKPEMLAYTSSIVNRTDSITSIPPDFEMDHDLELPYGFRPEACFTNIIAALAANALRDFEGTMPITNIRTTRFPEPLVKMTSPGHKDIKRQFIVWGLFQVAFFLHAHNSFNMGFFSFHYKSKEVADIGLGGTPTMVSSRGMSSSGALAAIPPNEELSVDFAFYGPELGKGAVFMTIITSLLEAAPQTATAGIYQPIINYLQNEPAAFVVNPTEKSKSARGPSFTNEMLIDSLVRASDFFVEKNVYRQLEMNISFDGVLLAQGAILRRSNLGFLGPLNATEPYRSA